MNGRQVSVQDAMIRRYAEVSRYSIGSRRDGDEELAQYWRGYADGMRFVLEAHHLWHHSLERISLDWDRALQRTPPGYDLGEDPGEQMSWVFHRPQPHLLVHL
jgi:hypothetical protein